MFQNAFIWNVSINIYGRGDDLVWELCSENVSVEYTLKTSKNSCNNYYCSNCVNMSDLNKKYILNSNPDLSSDICTFIKQSL